MSDATDVLRAIDQLRRDLSGYHGQLVAHDDLQRHCDNQRKRIADLEGLYAKAKAENAKLRRLVSCLVNAENPFDRATLIANASEMLAELGVEVDG